MRNGISKVLSDTYYVHINVAYFYDMQAKS